MTQDEARAAGMHGWQLVTCDNGVHCLPVGDTHEHTDEDCACGAKQDQELVGVWVHNSFDGREAFEEGERRPS